MKAVILQNDFNKWLNVVSRVVPSRGQLPVLANILIEAEKEGLRLAATNLEVGLRVEVASKVNKPGAITIPARSLVEFVGSMPAGNVEIEVEGEKLKVAGGKLTATFSGIAATEFPVMQKLEEIKKGQGARLFKLKKQIITEIATQVAYAAAGDESRPVLTGVLINFANNKMTVTATDGFRLSRKVVSGTEAGEEGKSLIIPARTILELARIVSEGKKDEVVLGVVAEANQVVVGYDGVELMSRVLEGNFPDVEKIIPIDFKTEITADKEELVRGIKAAGIFARESSNVVRFKIEDKLLKISASSASVGESEIEIEIEKKGDDGQIAFNYRYVQDFLNSTGEERIVFKMTESLAPGVFGIEGNTDLTHLIMPVRV